MNTRRVVEVHADWEPLDGPTLMGRLSVSTLRGKEIFSFEYDRAWLEGPHGRPLDPALVLYPGPQYPSADRANFGLFLDSCPDRWGRVLMRRREAQMARSVGRPEHRRTDYPRRPRTE